MKKIILLLAFFMITGCSSIPYATKDEDSYRKQFNISDESQAGIYIYRNSIFFADAVTREIKLNGSYVGSLPVESYLYLSVGPGNHTLSTESSVSDNEIFLTTEKGKNYFLKQALSLGVPLMGAAANLKLVSEEIGKKEILKKSLIAPINNDH